MSSDVSILLNAIQQGDSAAVDELLPLIYNQLREMARAKLAHESAGQTLQATALVHEAYIRLVDTPVAQKWHSREWHCRLLCLKLRRATGHELGACGGAGLGQPVVGSGSAFERAGFNAIGTVADSV